MKELGFYASQIFKHKLPADQIQYIDSKTDWNESKNYEKMEKKRKRQQLRDEQHKKFKSASVKGAENDD